MRHYFVLTDKPFGERDNSSRIEPNPNRQLLTFIYFDKISAVKRENVKYNTNWYHVIIVSDGKEYIVSGLLNQTEADDRVLEANKIIQEDKINYIFCIGLNEARILDNDK